MKVPDEIVILFGLSLCTPNSIDGVKYLLRFKQSSSRIYAVLSQNKTLWQRHFEYLFTRAISFASRKLAAECISLNIVHLVRISDSILERECHERVFNLRLQSTLLDILYIFTYAAHFDDDAKTRINENGFIREKLSEILRVEGFLQNIVNDEPWNSFENPQPVKYAFLLLALVLRLPFKDCVPINILKPRICHNLRSCAQPNMTEFLENFLAGEWAGFYADYRLDLTEESEIRKCDGPMTNVKFSWDDHVAELLKKKLIAPVLGFTGTGRDDFGKFGKNV
ncbi:hypothetical protein HK100_010757 [Physocladia obscura]|uniref:Uncharacterized protein n=1 Tax=Physocladia obscura TaxID=109957 RepID=A0AAD5T3Y2_9FUNG|nr:hypothetical protein HK100_010757 [Physocladia obscura]